MSICPGCGGVIGRDCFNSVECQQIAASMNNQAEYENEQLKNELQRLQAACIQKDAEIARLKLLIADMYEQYNKSSHVASLLANGASYENAEYSWDNKFSKFKIENKL